MKQLLLPISRCAALTCRGRQCQFRARYGKFCGHHANPTLQRFLTKMNYRKKRTLSEDLPGNY